MKNSSNSHGMVRSVLSSSVGNVIEWYEYTLYAYFAVVIKDLFFPMGNNLAAMLMTRIMD